MKGEQVIKSICSASVFLFVDCILLRRM